MNKPHKHAEVLKAIADGKEVQRYDDFSNKWADVCICFYNPINQERWQWRVKPEPKPDYCFYGMYDANSAGYMSEFNPSQTSWEYKMKITIDGETNEPKSVELVK